MRAASTCTDSGSAGMSSALSGSPGPGRIVTDPGNLNGNWSGQISIPNTWAVGTEVAMGAVGRRDDHGVHRRVLQQRERVGIGARDAGGGRRLGKRRRACIRQRGDDDVATEAETGDVVGHGDSAGADQAEAKCRGVTLLRVGYRQAPATGRRGWSESGESPRPRTRAGPTRWRSAAGGPKGGCASTGPTTARAARANCPTGPYSSS